MMAVFPEADTVAAAGAPAANDVSSLSKYRGWFRAAVDKAGEWRGEAREDYEFVAGRQWRKEDRSSLEKQGRPCITINKIKPLINVLSGYQRLNRYDISFLPRTSDDMELCKVRDGITKYVMDRCDYEYQESQAFLDVVICGFGWLEVGYKFDQEIGDGEAIIRRESPFSMYVDPESRQPDCSDAKFIIRARWTDKDQLCSVYPEHKAEIRAQARQYDEAEDESGDHDMEPLWYQEDTKKLRLVECWYKVKERRKVVVLPDGRMLDSHELTNEMVLGWMLEGVAVQERTIFADRVRVCVFFDQVLLEDKESPYEHGEFPFVPLAAYNFGEGDIPAGIVRDLKDPQREINKRRSQMLHILNTASNSGWIAEAGVLAPDQKRYMRNNGSTPGVILEVLPGGLGKLQRLEPAAPPVAIIQAEQEAMADLPAISGINESLMGTDIPNSASGRAIELKQKQAITHIAPLFDNLRKAKKRIAYLLWGRRGHKGIIQQYYTEEKVYRVEGPNGQPDFIRVNQQVQQQDPLRGVITTTLNDLSQGEFDVVVADTQASTTQRAAQMWSLVDAVSKLGVPGDMVFDIIIDLSDIPDKDAIKQRWQERQEAQQQQRQAQLQAEQAKQIRMSESIAFKDAPMPIQLAMAAKAGLIDPQIAQYAVNQFVQQYFPQFAQMEARQKQQQSALQQAAQALQQGAPAAGNADAGGQMQRRPDTMTAAAVKSLIAGQAPAI